MPPLTVIMLNYRRPNNIPMIVDALSMQTVEANLWLWNNSGVPITDSRLALQITSDANLRCWPRWVLASYATTESVLMIDDDLVPTSNTMLEIALEALERQASPDTIVGAEGVVLGAGQAYWPSYPGRVARATFDGDPATSVHIKKALCDVSVDIVKGRCLAVRTQALKGLPLSPEHRDTCDDIVVSGLLAAGRRRPHQVSAALGAALADIPDASPDIALSRSPTWREVRESARAHYYRRQGVD